MKKYYTRVCNFYYGINSQRLINKKKSLPLNDFEPYVKKIFSRTPYTQ